MRARFTEYAVPGWGTGELWTDAGVLLTHEFRFDPVSDTAVPALPESSPDSEVSPTPAELADRFTAFLAGADVGFDDVPIDLEWATEFQCAVAAAIRSLARGEVASYGELAALAGYPGAARAVGTFCAHNRFMFVVPCHRVVGATGIGGYGSAGADTKRRLLALEGVAL